MTPDDITNQELLSALTQQLGIITDNMMVRKDVEEIVDGAIQKAVAPLATKEELKKLATKEELKKLATKDDLDAMEQRFEEKFATKEDVGRLEQKMRNGQRANVQHHLVTRQAIGDINRELISLREGLARAASSAESV